MAIQIDPYMHIYMHVLINATDYTHSIRHAVINAIEAVLSMYTKSYILYTYI